MTSIEDTTASLSEVDFPSVTICNVNQVGGEDKNTIKAGGSTATKMWTGWIQFQFSKIYFQDKENGVAE